MSEQMDVDEAARKLNDELAAKFGLGVFSVGVGRTDRYDGQIWLTIYEHKRGFGKIKLTDLDYEGYVVERKYVGKVRPALGS